MTPTKLLLVTVIALIVLSVGFTYWKIMVAGHFVVINDLEEAEVMESDGL